MPGNDLRGMAKLLHAVCGAKAPQKHPIPNCEQEKFKTP